MDKTASTHPLLVALREAAAAAARAAKIEARLYGPGTPGVAELTDSEGVADRVSLDR